MNQVADILELATQAKQQDIEAVLATVVRTDGSAYRRAGAMMLICADGQSVGMISGGCLEPHIIKRAFWLTRDGANIQVYQTGDEQADDVNDELNFGLGCNGCVHVLFERLASAWPFLQIIKQTRNTQEPALIATLIRSDTAQHLTGLRIDLDNHAVLAGLKPAQSDMDVAQRSQQLLEKHPHYPLSKRHTKYVTINDSGSLSEWLIQRIKPQMRLLICGAGNDVLPLVAMAKMQDWHVTVIDSRAHYATRARFVNADQVMCVPVDDQETLLSLSQNAAVAVMSHSLAQDRARLAVLLQHPPRYLGQLGPRYRTERLLDEISAMIDPALLADGIAKLHYPIGYKLGGDGPEALALSIMAQISAVMNEQTPPAICFNNTSQSQLSAENDCTSSHIIAANKHYVHDS